MQAWGSHTYEDYRPTEIFPTRSGIVGLIGACAGFKRHEVQKLSSIEKSITITVRNDMKQNVKSVKMTDYHTVLGARTVSGKANVHAIQSYREYLLDSSFSVAIGQSKNASVSLEEISEWVHNPTFTPYLGRKACPIGRPLFEAMITAKNATDALKNIKPIKGTIFTEEPTKAVPIIRVRDVPIRKKARQFATRLIYIINEKAGGENE